MLNFVEKTKYDFHERLLRQGEELVGNIQNAIEHSISGNLKASVRMKDVSTSDGTKLSILVMAGGPLTTKHERSGSHDYSLDEEFGNQKEPPRPFFFNTVRLYKNLGLEQFQETLDQTIEENNKVRSLRAINYNSNGFTVVKRVIVLKSNTAISNGYRGAIVIQGKPLNG